MRLGTTQDGRPLHPLAMARKLRGVSLRALADEVEMTAVGISHIETGRSEPRRSTKRILAQALGYEVTDIWPRNNGLPAKELRASSNGNGKVPRRGS
jgi:transcriptional regulator with XRE-family HTH domain